MSRAIRGAVAIAAAAVIMGEGGFVHAREISGRLTVGAAQRSYVMVVPEGAKKRLPTVIALHGAVMDGRGMQRTFALDKIAERERFIAVYPDGLYHRWNDGRPAAWGRAAERVNDVAFLTALAKHLTDEELADPRRLYLVGVSNGGMMAFRMACEAPKTFTAYAAIIANMPANLIDKCRPQTGVPMLIMNSTKDPFIPWQGGRLGFAGRLGRVVSTEESMSFWQRNNGCTGPRQRKPLPDKDPKDGSKVLAEQYNHCRSGAPVVLMAIEGAGHLPPGAEITARPLIEAVLGKGNRDVSAADISWKFFRRFPARQ
jgi:polyhydroxybutyrate depolymerase